MAILRDYYVYFEFKPTLREFDTFENLLEKYPDAIKIEEV